MLIDLVDYTSASAYLPCDILDLDLSLAVSPAASSLIKSNIDSSFILGSTGWVEDDALNGGNIGKEDDNNPIL